MSYDLNGTFSWFEDFTQSFLKGTERDKTCIQVKIGHSMRVLENAQHISGALGLNGTFADLVQMAALLHDVGRFPQYERYKTYHDGVSVNHGRLGVNVLRDNRVLAPLSPDHRKLILGSVALHNRKALPQTLRPRLRTLTAIIRDADKLDIIYVILSHLTDKIIPEDGVVTLHLKDHPEAYTPEILRAVKSMEIVNYQDLVWMNDLKLLLLGWAYAFEYDVSRRILQDKGYIDRLLDLLPRSEEFQSLRRQFDRETASFRNTLSKTT